MLSIRLYSRDHIQTHTQVSDPSALSSIAVKIESLTGGLADRCQPVNGCPYEQKGEQRREPRNYLIEANRHHWNLHCGMPAKVKRRSPSAQRLSASLESSHSTRRRGARRPRGCSTPFGIIGIFTRNNKTVQCGLGLVLNAFRHHWNLHSDFRLATCGRLTCSTPFGIIGIFTSARFELDHSSLSCSTPFGIIGIFTLRGKRVVSTRTAVLNAFRHHWNLHMICESHSPLF